MVETTFQGTPDWYGGAEGIIKKLVERAQSDSLSKYQPYGAERVAPFSPLQQRGFDIASGEVDNPEYQDIYNQSKGLITNAAGQDISGRIAPFLQAGTANPTENASQYMNPYQDAVINNIGKYATRNLTENILPNVKDRFIRAGQYGSTGHQDLTGRAIRDTQEGVSQASANALQGGYNTALSTSVGQQGRNLEAGQLAAQVGDRDVNRKLVSGETLSNLGQNQQNQGLRTAGFVNTLGGQQQQQRQNQDNTAYQEFQNERNYPFFQTARLNEIVRGLPVNTQQFSNSTGPTPPTASPWTQGAGLVGGLTGALNQRQGFSKGGRVKKVSHHIRHYADGGKVSLSPIQRGVNDALDTEELKSMRDMARRLERPQVDPFWSSVARAGFNVASNRQPGVLAALGQGANAGLDEYNTQLDRQDQRGMGSSKIMEIIDNTRRMQAERNRKHEFDLEKFGHDKSIDMAKLGIEKEKLGMQRDSHERSKNLITGADGRLYQLGKNEEGKMVATPIEGMEPKNSIFKKANEKAAEEIRSSSSSLPALESTVNELKDVADRLDTGPGKGRVSQAFSTIGDIPLVGKWLAAGESGDVNKFDALTNELVLSLGNQLKGSVIALGKLKIIEKTKPSLLNSRKGNQEILKHIEDLIQLTKDKNEFMTEALGNGMNANDAEAEFNKIIDSKGNSKDISSSDNIDISKISEDELKKYAGE